MHLELSAQAVLYTWLSFGGVTLHRLFGGTLACGNYIKKLFIFIAICQLRLQPSKSSYYY